MDSMHHRVHAIRLESSDINKRNSAHFLAIVDIGSTEETRDDDSIVTLWGIMQIIAQLMPLRLRSFSKNI